MGLTKKRENFALLVATGKSLSDAYRQAYSCDNPNAKSVHELASTLNSDIKVSSRIEELREVIIDKVIDNRLYTLEQSVKRDLKMIERYEAALEVLDNPESDDKAIERANRTIRHIGASGYNSAQERLSKQHGFYEADNRQRTDTKPAKIQFIPPNATK